MTNNLDIPKKELIMPRVCLRSNRELELESKVSELQGLLTIKTQRWDLERRQLLREFEELKKGSTSPDLLAPGNHGSPLKPKRSILRSKSFTLSEKVEKHLHWDASVSRFEAEREKKLRVEATFMSIYQARNEVEDAHGSPSPSLPHGEKISHRHTSNLDDTTKIGNVLVISQLYENNGIEKSADEPLSLASGRRRRPKLELAEIESPPPSTSPESTLDSPLSTMNDPIVEYVVEQARTVEVIDAGLIEESEKVTIKCFADSTETAEELTATEDVAEEPVALNEPTKGLNGFAKRLRKSKSLSVLFQRKLSKVEEDDAEDVKHWRRFFRFS
jgi:hypothetical protein